LPPTSAAERRAAAARVWSDACEAIASGSAQRLAEQLQRCPELRAAHGGAGETLLHVAAGAGRSNLVDLLSDAGVTSRIEDDRGLTAGDTAFAAGSQACFDELVKRASARHLEELEEEGEEEDPAAKRQKLGHGTYLSQRLRYVGEQLLDEDGLGVMMGWETPLMVQHARVLLPQIGSAAAVLNVGFGLGIVDGLLQERAPGTHHIIEAHPDVLAEMHRRGWHEKSGVHIHTGRWQEVVSRLAPQSLDAVFFDTWQETYVELRAFLQHLPRLLRPGGRFSFFNGLAPYSIFHHAVFCRVAQEDLAALELPCDFLPVPLGSLGEDSWLSAAQRYWQFETYYLPLAVRAASPGANTEASAAGASPEAAPAAAEATEATPPAAAAGDWRPWPEAAVLVADRVGKGPCGDGPRFWERALNS